MTPAPDPINEHLVNLFAPDWDEHAEEGAYQWRRMRVSRRAGSEQLGASMYEVPPGASTFPLHAHHANEELIVVLSGHFVLITTEGERPLGPGDVVACLTGLRGAHRLRNDTDEPASVLIVSTMNAPDINEFPDSGILWARTWAPGDAAGSGDRQLSGDAGGFNPLSLP